MLFFGGEGGSVSVEVCGISGDTGSDDGKTYSEIVYCFVPKISKFKNLP